MKTFFYGLVVVFFVGIGCGTTTQDLPVVQNFNASRYLGVWYEVARFPHAFERDMEKVSACYSLDSDSKFRVVNSGSRHGETRTVQASGYFPEGPNVGYLRVTFFWPFYGDYRILDLDSEYTTAVVTSGTMDYLWILARTPTLPDSILQSKIQTAKSLGFDVKKLEFPAPTAPVLSPKSP